MIQTCIQPLYDGYADAIRHGLHEAISAQEPEAFHRLRVGIKKTRSMLMLVESLNPTFDSSKHYRKLRPLFKAAAEVRDFQVQRQLVAKVSDAEKPEVVDYLQHLGTRAEKGAARFEKAARKFDVAILDRLRNAILGAIEPLEDEAAGVLARARIRVLLGEVAVWSSGEGESDPHTLRTITKRAFYTWEAVQNCLPGVLDDDRTRNGLQDLQQLLGRWHDHHVAANTLARYIEKTGEVSDDRRTLLETLRQNEARLLKRSLDAKARLNRHLVSV